MNWAIKIIPKSLMTKISSISWGGYDKGFYGNLDLVENKFGKYDNLILWKYSAIYSSF